MSKYSSASKFMKLGESLSYGAHAYREKALTNVSSQLDLDGSFILSY